MDLQKTIISINWYFLEIYNNPENAILREKQIKAGLRTKKVKLIMGINP